MSTLDVGIVSRATSIKITYSHMVYMVLHAVSCGDHPALINERPSTESIFISPAEKNLEREEQKQ